MSDVRMAGLERRVRELAEKLEELSRDRADWAKKYQELRDSEKLKKMRDRIESLRGLCKTAVGYLRDENAEKQAAEIAILIGDMEPTLNQTLESETASELRRLHEVNTELREKVAAMEKSYEDLASNLALANKNARMFQQRWQLAERLSPTECLCETDRPSPTTCTKDEYLRARG